jgi:hypothetical protein
MRKILCFGLGALLAMSTNGQSKTANPVTARDFYEELKAANEFKTYADEYVCFYDDDIPSFLVAAKGEDSLLLMAANGEKVTKETGTVKGHLFYKTYYKGVLTGDLEEMPPKKDSQSGDNISYQDKAILRDSKATMTITYNVNWATGRIRFTVEAGTPGVRGYSNHERYGKCEFIHPETPILLDQSIPKELRENRCFQSKTPEERDRWLREIVALPKTDFEKTMKDLGQVNEADRLSGTKGCGASK